MAFIDSRPFRALFALLFGIAVFAVCLTGWWASTYYLAIRDVEQTVTAQLANAKGIHTGAARTNGGSATVGKVDFDKVTFNKATRIGCGYVSVANRPGSAPERSQFILFGDGSVKFAPPADKREGDPMQQIAALEKQRDYAALVVQNCLN